MAIVDFATGDGHSVFLTDLGQVYCVGDNAYGQLGNDSTQASTTPVLVDINDVIQVAAGKLFTMALKGDGTVWTWGNDDAGQLGNGFLTGGPYNRKIPNQVRYTLFGGNYANLTNITRIAAGTSTGYAIDMSGAVWNWGFYSFARETENSEKKIQIAEAAHDMFYGEPNLYGAIDVAGGSAHTMILYPNGDIYVISDNVDGQSGQGHTNPANTSLLKVPGVIAKAIGSGYNHLLAILSDGTVSAWGGGGYGKLGNGDTNMKSSPTAVATISNIIQVDGGEDHSLAVEGNGNIWSWGRNTFFALGDGTSIDRWTPVRTGTLGVPTTFHLCPLGEGGGDEPSPDYPTKKRDDPDPTIPEPCANPPIPPTNVTAPTGPNQPPTNTIDMPPPPDMHQPPYDLPPPLMPTQPITVPPIIGPTPIDEIEVPELPPMPCLTPPPFPSPECPGGPGSGTPPGHPGGPGPGTGYTPPILKPPGPITVITKPPYPTDDIFTSTRCYTDKLVLDAIRELCAEMGLNPAQMIIDPSCTKRFTTCFEKGSRKWDAIWWLSDICELATFDPGDGNPIEIQPTTPLAQTWIYHEFINLLEFTRNYDALDVYYAVEVFRPASKRGGSVTTPSFVHLEIVDTPFNVSPDKVMQIQADPTWSDQDCIDRARTEASKMVGGLNISAAIPLNLEIRYRHQLIIMRPTAGFSQRFMVMKKEQSINDQGHITLITARFLSQVNVIHVKGVPDNLNGWPDYFLGYPAPGAPKSRTSPAGFVRGYSIVRIRMRPLQRDAREGDSRIIAQGGLADVILAPEEVNQGSRGSMVIGGSHYYANIAPEETDQGSRGSMLTAQASSASATIASEEVNQGSRGSMVTAQGG